MSLSKRTFIYSSIISAIVVSLMVLYFVLMFPALYVDYMKQVNYYSIKNIQEQFIKDDSYKNISSINPSQNITLKIPNEGDKIFFYHSLFSLEIEIEDKNVLNTINIGREILKDYDINNDFEDEDFKFIEDIILAIKNSVNLDEIPYKFTNINNTEYAKFELLSENISIPSNNTIIYETNVTDNINYYTTYMAISNVNNNLVLTILPVMTPQLSEVTPIIFQSLPMIIGVAILIIIIAALLFSRKIINPVKELADHAEYIKENASLDINPMVINGEDEIAQLGQVLNELYIKLNNNFKELEEKNSFLQEQNNRQEVFLRASSHQLKTPIAASILLLDGMINEIGKFKNTKEYLPKVKEQVLSMKDIVDSILSLNNGTLDLNINSVNLHDILIKILNSYKIQIKEKNIDLVEVYESVYINIDEGLLFKIIDNLISNAIKYTDINGKIKVNLNNENIKITNYGSHIDDNLLPHIFEPFVSSSTKEKGHGLGLYIVSYYCKLLNIDISVDNIKDGVESIVTFKKYPD